MKKIFQSAFVLLSILSINASAYADAVHYSAVSEKKNNSPDAVNVLKDRISVHFPEGFVKMTEKQLLEKYAAARPRPEEAWYYDTGKSLITFTFSLPFPGKPLTDEQVPRIAEMIKKQMINMKPVLTTLKIDGRTVSRLESVANDSSGSGNKVASVLQISSLDNQLMMITFNVPDAIKEKYYSSGLNSLDSVRY